ncbi:hypothetical protein ACIBBE_24275 [Streptomyces sp. NPDC051644]|uniref:hypothetical protein n=1 Tax=Streptomyces sp. NPDC051644 TaxID=3365666 RepID=UPI00378C1DD2
MLVETLRLAVPRHIEELLQRPTADLLDTGLRSASIIGPKGDVLQFGSPKHGAAEEAFNALAQGLAAAALVTWGGVTFAGMHWCADPGCSDRDADHPEPKFIS